ncbi:hypothetical protein B0H13DRAFT_2350745 [Mycena leptocephala]|nr:hypothetical protein B0H13DRAFT_2350745 [Mycena leptocephala]
MLSAPLRANAGHLGLNLPQNSTTSRATPGLEVQGGHSVRFASGADGAAARRRAHPHAPRGPVPVHSGPDAIPPAAASPCDPPPLISTRPAGPLRCPRPPWGRTRKSRPGIRRIAAPRATSRIQEWAPLGPYNERGKTRAPCTSMTAPPAATTRWELERGYCARKKAVKQGKEGVRAGKIAVLLGRHSTKAQSLATLAPAPDGIFEDRRCATSGVNESAERAHPRDWPAHRSSSAATVYSA